ncbi:hypothetical protein FRB94_011296 [Tulasnella sp. JGI-2019a]|nr:hypothetical protein FRB93_010119 [Tulasnella sp. JGI-2019a]KAG8992801.1 hypothetical protein FRB94_011296 [Tulasnella sp. JGI-2019a]
MSTPSSQKPTVAISGATSDLGIEVTKAFLKFSPDTFSRVLVLTRNPQSEKASALGSLGAKLVQVDGALQPDVLKGVDVLVNTLGLTVSSEVSDSLFEAAIAAGVKVYFPSEYGIIQNHAWFHEITRHVAAARNAGAKRLKVIQLLTGMFTEWVFAPYVGFDTKGGVYTSLGLGTAEKKIAITSIRDIGAALTRLAILALADHTLVPDQVRITGDNQSINELADIIGGEIGKKITVVDEPVTKSSGQPDGEGLSSFIQCVFS